MMGNERGKKDKEEQYKEFVVLNKGLQRQPLETGDELCHIVKTAKKGE